MVLLAVLLLLGDGGGDADLDAEGSLDLLLGGLLSSSLQKLEVVWLLSLLDPLLPGLWSAVAFLAPGCDGGLPESFFLLHDDGGEAEVAEAGAEAEAEPEAEAEAGAESGAAFPPVQATFLHLSFLSFSFLSFSFTSLTVLRKMGL